MPRPASVKQEYTGEAARSGAARLLPLRWFRCVRDDLRRLFAGRHIVHEFVLTTLRGRYRTSFLGFLWTLVHPLLFLIVLSIVFGKVMRFEMDHYPVFLFSGLIPWQFFSASISTSGSSLLANQGLIRKIQVNLMLFPVSAVMVAAVNMMFAMIAMFILFMFLGASISVHLVLVPAGLVLLFLFTLGLGLIAMTLTTFFRDFEHIISILMQALFFATPIIYPAHAMHSLAPLLSANPLSWFLTFFQHGLYYHTWPPVQLWVVSSVISLITLSIGYAMYKRYEHEYIFRL